MASEQKLDVCDNHPVDPNHSSVTSQQTVDPPSGSELPNCCPSDSEHKEEPVTLPVTATLVNGVNVEGQGSGTGDLEISREVQQEGSGSEGQYVLEKNGEGGGSVTEKEQDVTCEDQPGQETNTQVLSLGETGQQGADEETGPKVIDNETGSQVTEGETVTNEETDLPVRDESDPQVTGEETGEQVTGEETGLHLMGEVTDQQVTSKESSLVEATDTDVPENAPVHVTDAGEKWIETLVRNIVTEVTKEGACAGDGTGEQVEIPGEGTDGGGVPLTEEGTQSIVQVSETNITTGEQVTEGAGAAVQGNVKETSAHVQVCDESTGITVPVSGEQQGTQVRGEGLAEVTDTPEVLNREETGEDNLIELSCEEADVDLREAAGAQVCASGEEVNTDAADKVETGRQVTASGEEAERKVTPDIVSDPGREGTPDPQRPVACREKEWLPLICTGREVWADTAVQGETEQGTVTEEKLCHRTPDPEMKEREIVQEGEALAPETPIEREIRLTMERELILRQERGISVPVGQPEFVEVRRKTITVEPMAQAGKERQLAGAQMQREIQLETRREQDLVDLGKVMGTYDRGPQQELQERKLIFESLNTESSDPPIKKSPSESQQSTILVVTATEVPVASDYVAPIEIKKGPSYAEANGSNVIILEQSSVLRRSAPGNVFSSAPADSYRSAPTDLYRSAPADSRRSTPADFRRFPSTEASRASLGGSPPPNSADSPIAAPGSPFQLLRSPSPRSLLEREIEEVQERERELRRQRNSVYGRDDSAVETTQKEPENRSDVQSGIYQPERPSWRRLDVNWPPNTGVITNGQQQEQVSDSPYTRRQRSALIQSWESGNPNPLGDE